MTDSVLVSAFTEQIASAVADRVLAQVQAKLAAINAPSPQLLLPRSEARAMLGNISETTFYRLERRELLKAHPAFRHKLYPVAALKKFAEKGVTV